MSYIIRCINNNLVNMGNQWWFEYYVPGVQYLIVEQNINSSLTLNYHVTNYQNSPISNTLVHLIIGKAYSGSNAIVSYNGRTTSGIENNTDQLNVTGTTDIHGNISFTILGSSIIDKYTQVCAYVNNPGKNAGTDIIDIIDIIYSKFLENTQNTPLNNQLFNIQIGSGVNQNIFTSNPLLDRSLYKVYSSDSKIATIDGLGNIKLKSKGKFCVIITDIYGNIISTIPFLI